MTLDSPGPRRQERLKVTRINYEPITVFLRQLRERRGLLRLRSWHPAARLRRMCMGSGGNPGWSLTTAFIGCPNAREFGPRVARGEPWRVHRPRALTFSSLQFLERGAILLWAFVQ